MPPPNDELVNPRRRSRPGERGTPGHVTRAGPAGLEFHCPGCDELTLHVWPKIEQSLSVGRDPMAVNTVRLPPCACGSQSWLAIDEEHDGGEQETDDDLTRRAVHEQVMPRFGHLGLRVRPKERLPVERPDPPRPIASGHDAPTVESRAGELPGPED